MNSFAPVVLLVDDDPGLRLFLRRRFNNESSLAPLIFSDLKSAKLFFDDESSSVDAVLSDISFAGDTSDPDHQLEDGLDMLNLVQSCHPNIPKYVISMWSDEPAFHDKSDELGLKIRNWFPKLNYGDPMKTPWSQIERDLLREALMKGGDLADEASRQGWLPDDDDSYESVLEWFRKHHKSMKFSFIQEVPADYQHYKIIKPLKVVCRRENGEAIAESMHLGLLDSGRGDDVEEAIKDLADKIMNLKEQLDEYPDEQIIEYAALIKNRLDEHVLRLSPEQLS
ncbi:hypothetical protein [Neptuniibacter sp.]|uniref:hypothetical protein n=1 Tax=Neptuniibacter sp. TaxID=1962643 RepID=UPI0026340280|nr:hypothetical protein [Neptuniibacter sp.]MCP4597279.1 hypothetical protein [Neptuniibacter sp.]